MNVFYNKHGIGDTLIVWLKDISRVQQAVEKKGDVARLFDHETKETTGYNVFRFSRYGTIEGNGVIVVTEDLVPLINDALQSNEFEANLPFDDTPDFVVGYVKEKENHPDADKLSVCKVDIGDEALQIVCGAPNVEAGQKVVVARVGAMMPSGTLIQESNLRGVDSYGMICAARELDLPNAPQKKGILVLDDEYEIGKDFFQQAQCSLG